MENFKDCPHCGSNNWGASDKARGGSPRKKCMSCKRRIVTFKIAIDSDLETITKTETNQYKNEKPPALTSFINGRNLTIEEYCEHYNFPIEKIRSHKHVAYPIPYYNIAFFDESDPKEFLTEEFFSGIVTKLSKKFKSKNIIPEKKTSSVVRGIYTDMHIGMDPDKKSIALYSGTWDKEDQYNRIIQFANDVICEAKNKNSSKCIVDELGDFVDGWDGQTVRKGHNLPQNMTNTEMFDQAVSLKVNLCDMLWSQNMFSEIIFNNICNDNHAGDFGYIVNSAFKSIIEAKYENVSVVNHRKFISHYIVGKHTKIISHGKDMEDSKFGFKPKLDQPGEKKISNYIIANNLSGRIEFSKGDSHQCLYDYATSDLFSYLNHCSMAPPSQWVQTNFQKGTSGYSIQTFNEDLETLPITNLFEF